MMFATRLRTYARKCGSRLKCFTGGPGIMRVAFLLLGVFLAMSFGGCLYEDEPWQPPADDWDIVAPDDPASCGGENCAANEHCSLVNFKEACLCGVQPACAGANACKEGESGRFSCDVLQPGQTGCGYDGLECEVGDTCVNTSLVGPTMCVSLCKATLMFCDDGAYCSGLSDTEYLGGMTGFCNIGGDQYYGQSCDSNFDCIPKGLCVSFEDTGNECMQPCRVGQGDCPSYQDCYAFIGSTWEGSCM